MFSAFFSSLCQSVARNAVLLKELAVPPLNPFVGTRTGNLLSELAGPPLNPFVGATSVNLLSDSDIPSLNPFVGITNAENFKIWQDLASGNAGVAECSKTIHVV